jgi:2-dehydropantoate 2-reductase
MRVCIYGAGAVGTCLAGRLAAAGAEVSVVARGANLAAIRENGVRVRTPDQEIAGTVAASDDPAALGRQDIVLVAVKTPSLPSIADGLRTLLGPDTVVGFVMNGIPWWYFLGQGGELEGRRLPRIDPDDRIRNTVAIERVLGGVFYGGCDIEAPGVVQVESRQTRLTFGRPDGAASPAAEALAAALTDTDFRVEVVSDIRRVIWSKLQVNLASGLFGALAGAAPRDIWGNDPVCAEAVRRLVDEVRAVAAAMGWPTTLTADALLDATRTQAHKSSIVQDLEAGRPMELEATFAAPQEIARLAVVPTPTLDLLLALVRVRARASGAWSG